MRILVVEDEAWLADFVRQGLVQVGHVADVADNGPTGLELAATTPYDVILLDLMLPGQNGCDVLRNLREFGVPTPVAIYECAQRYRARDSRPQCGRRGLPAQGLRLR